MTGTGSGYIGNRCVLNPFAGITPLYLHNLFPFIEVRSVPPLVLRLSSRKAILL